MGGCSPHSRHFSELPRNRTGFMKGLYLFGYISQELRGMADKLIVAAKCASR